jgi:GntR family transcriptional regulator of arabinose operon
MNRAIALSKVDHRDPTPKYLQAREILLDAIRTGRFAPGAKLPSTEEISALIDVSLITAHKALGGLVELGWLRREAGRGTYVRDDVDPVNGVRPQLSVGLLFDHQEHVNIDDYYHSSLINGLRRAARADSARHVEFFIHDGFDLHHKATKRDVAAICIHPPLESQPAVERLARRHPLVILGGTLPGAGVACVDCDNQSGARQAVRHLLELGHRRFMVF